MLDIKEGQFAITEDHWGFGVKRADKVTARQIRTLRYGNRYAHTDRSVVIAVCDTKEAAQSLVDRLDNARRTFANERSNAITAFNKVIAPMEAARDRAVEEARARFRQKVERLVASADRSGEADETSTKIEGSSEGESAVPKADAHA